MTIRLWDMHTGEHKKTLNGHKHRVYSVAFSPDGETLASGSEDNTIRLWSVDTGETKMILTGHAGEFEGFNGGPVSLKVSRALPLVLMVKPSQVAVVTTLFIYGI